MRRQHKREPLTLEETDRLEKACSTMRDKLVVWTLLDSGMRVEELCNLDKLNIDWFHHSILLHGKNTTGGERKIRRVPMTPRVKPIMEAWIAANDSIKISIRTANRVVHRVAKKAGLARNCSPHILRHTFAVHSLEKGIPLPALRDILGHEDLMTTAIYLNMSNSEALRIYKERW